MATDWRLVLDCPASFSEKPGYIMARHSHDMRPEELGDDIWIDPLTKVVMLKPSFLREGWHGDDDWTDLSEWTYDANFWQQVFPVFDPDLLATLPKFFTTTAHQTTGSETLVGIATDVSIGVISLASALASDALVWSLQSNFTLGKDAGFVVHYNAVTRKMARYKNWFAVQWDRLYLHFSFDGYCRPYYFYEEYADGATPLTPFQIADPGDMAGEDGYISFIPIAGYGLAIYNSKTAQRVGTTHSSADLAAARGHLLRLPVYNGAGGEFDAYLLDESKIRVAVGSSLLRSQHLFGFHKITYPASAEFLDNIIDPGFRPNAEPSLVSVSPLYTSAHYAGDVIMTATLRNEGDTADWVAGTDRQGRVKVALSTTDARYTPMLRGTYVEWQPTFVTRGTTEFEPRLLALETVDDELARFEGEATVLAETEAERLAIERGDLTFRLEKKTESDADYRTHAGGIARVAGDVPVTTRNGRTVYTANLQLSDMRARYREVSILSGQAYEGLTLLQALNMVQYGSGLPAFSDAPAVFSSLTFPNLPEGETWQYSPNVGDSGEEVIDRFLLLTRAQRREFRIRHDWDSDTWTVEAKPRETGADATWTLTPYADEIEPVGAVSAGYNPVTRQIRAESVSFAVSPPEANLIQPQGKSGSGKEEKIIPGTPIDNVPSVYDPESVDYLGRVVGSAPVLPSEQSLARVNAMGRRFYDAAMHRRLRITAVCREWPDALVGALPARVIVRGELGGVRYDWQTAWVKRVTKSSEFRRGGTVAPAVTLHLDTLWEGEINT